MLGFGILTKEIVEYLMGLMIAVPNFRWVQLYKRLNDFYVSWCQGKFIDTAEETLPQTKLRELQNIGIHQLGQRQVDIYAGLNVMILLLVIQRYAQEDEVLKEHIIFYPSGQPEGNNFTYQLQKIIHYSNCLRNLVGQFLSGAHLRGASLLQINLSYADLTEADLSRASLCGANFSYANLNRAYFIGADLRDADFTSANLGETYLSGANLSRANISGANLKDVDLSRANLCGADLRGANFDNANFMGAILSDDTFGDIRWDEKTNWQNAEGLEMAKNVPLALKKRFL